MEGGHGAGFRNLRRPAWKAIATRLARDGDQVVLLGRRPEALEKAAAEITGAAAGDPVRWYRADLSEPDQVEATASAIVRDHGSVDVLVNNAGGVSTAATDTLAELAAAWRQDFDGNVLPTVLLTEALLPQITRPGGRIVAISSVAALRGAGSYAERRRRARLGLSLAEQARPGRGDGKRGGGFVPGTEFWAGRLTPRV
jgi:3-oxoacyl-[acyl-carrier protein] reductase